MTAQTLGQTDNCDIWYQDNYSHANARAQALQSAVERDFAKMAAWFNINAGFGPSNRVKVLIDTASIARNNNYHADGTSLITITPFNDKPDNSMSANATRALFVAELVEISMSYNNQGRAISWNPSGSNGEGVSRLCAATLYPDAYYNSDYLEGPYVNSWLGSATRRDWVGTTKSSDSNVDSYGCAILFLYFLHTQLGHPIQSIIQAGGDTLERTYQNLTGNSGGYNAMLQILSPLFPSNSWPGLQTDNPFHSVW